MQIESSSTSMDPNPPSPSSRALVQKPNNRIHARVFKAGDLVWAKAFPYTWWPGLVSRTTGSSAFVSFFRCDRSRWFRFAEIRGFEEDFFRISKMVGVKLSEETDVALEELSRRTAQQMMCSCRSLDSEEKAGFEPREMLGFLLRVAVDAWVGDLELASAVRLSTQVNAYRHYVKVCGSGRVYGEFDPSRVLEAVLDMAVSSDVDGDKSLGFYEVVRLVKAHRSFVLVRPGWMYRRTMEGENCVLSVDEEALDEESFDSDESESFEDSTDISDGNEKEVLFDSSPNGACEVIEELEGHMSMASYEDDFEEFQEQMQENKVICIMNTMDFSALDLNEENVSLLDAQPDTVPAVVESVIDPTVSNDSLMDGLSETVGFRQSVSDLIEDKNCLQWYKSGTVASTGKLFLDLNKDDETQVDNQPDTVSNSINSVGAGFFLNEMKVMQNADTVTLTDRLYAKAASNESFSPYRGESGDNKVAAVVMAHDNKDEPYDDNNHLDENVSATQFKDHDHQAAKIADLSDTSVTALKGKNIEDGIVVDAKHEANNLVLLPGSSSCNSLSKIPPCHGQPSIFLTNKYDAHSSADELHSSVNTLSNNDLIVTVTCKMNIFSGLPGFMDTTDQIATKKRKTDESIIVNEPKLQTVPTLDAKVVKGESSMEHVRPTCHGTASRDKVIAANSIGETASTPGIRGSGTSTFHSGDKMKRRKTAAKCSSDSPVGISQEDCVQKKGLELPIVRSFSDWRRFYASPLTPESPKSRQEHQGSPMIKKPDSVYKSLHMKFPKNYNLPSKEDLERKFRAFGPLDHSKTKIFFYTGAGQVVFMQQADAKAAYEYVTKKNIFGEANVRFWLDKYEKFRRGCTTQDVSASPTVARSSSNVMPAVSSPVMGCGPASLIQTTPLVGSSSANLKSCLKRPNVFEQSDQKRKSRVRFIMETR